MNPQFDQIIKLYFDIIKANTDVFKGYYYGDPVNIPVSMTPAILGSRRMSQAMYGTNLEDEESMTLVFTVITDIRKDISDDKQLVPGWLSIYDIMEGRDPVTKNLKPTSLLYILRHNFGIANNMWTDVRTATRIDYGLVQNKRQPGWSIEATVTVVCTIVQTR